MEILTVQLRPRLKKYIPNTVRFEFRNYRPTIHFVIEPPLVLELLGRGFVRERGLSFYTLRFPRIKKAKWVLSSDNAITFDELQEIAIESIKKQHIYNIDEHDISTTYDILPDIIKFVEGISEKPFQILTMQL